MREENGKMRRKQKMSRLFLFLIEREKLGALLSRSNDKMLSVIFRKIKEG